MPNSEFLKNKKKTRDKNDSIDSDTQPVPRHNRGIIYREVITGETPFISVYQLDLSLDGKTLYEGLDFSLTLGEKVTIAGENGAGKSTFLKVLAGVGNYHYSGTVEVEGRIAFLPQHFEDVDGDELAINVLLRSLYDEQVDELLDLEMEPFSPEWRYQLNSLDGHEIFRELKLLGLSEDVLRRPFAQLSGGEKTKTLLCALCVLQPDFLLLDEPTNHLDTAGIAWLENMLQHFDGGIVMVTHDRSLINAVATRVSELSPHTRRFVHFRGGYAAYLEEEAKLRERQAEERQRQEKQLRQIRQRTAETKSRVRGRIVRSGVDREKHQYNVKEQAAQKASSHLVNQLADKASQLEEELVEVVPPRPKVVFSLADVATGTVELLNLTVTDVSKSYRSELFRNVSFTLAAGERLVIRGPNGCGKSTLLKILAGAIEPDSGSVEMSRYARLGYLDQEQEGLPLEKSPVEFLCEDASVKATKQTAIKHLRMFGVNSWHDFSSPMKDLSVGCRRKVQLCHIVMRKCSVILLDEPTNHIDFFSLEAIEDGLLNFPGIVVAATHDRYFTEKVATRVLDLTKDCKEESTEEGG